MTVPKKISKEGYGIKDNLWGLKIQSLGAY